MRTLGVLILWGVLAVPSARAGDFQPPLLSPFAILGENGRVFLQDSQRRTVARAARTGRLLWTSERQFQPIGQVGRELVAIDHWVRDNTARLVFLEEASGKVIRYSALFELAAPHAWERRRMHAWVEAKELVVRIDSVDETPTGFSTGQRDGPVTSIAERHFELATGKLLRTEVTQARRSAWDPPGLDHPAYARLESRRIENGEELWLKPVTPQGKAKRLASGPSVAYELTRDETHVAVYRDEDGKHSSEIFSLKAGKRLGEIPVIPRLYLAIFQGQAWAFDERYAGNEITPILTVHALPSGRRIWSNEGPPRRTPLPVPGR